ncbi:hypothetical protein F511_05049 [Dorcoceras hygrometricum]|uniref:DUF630 domain-containing protein n=1 Tax=Dorcoceras hygrometricum TaxID=472368 RepID=A0A2Z7AQS2_9LAMI|nr:hypothetical protein F511_05049 [Dorcoceras hygrometricum]
MGCGGSKAEDSPLVVRCRERRELIRAAVNHRYALAAAHVSYFRSLKDVGVALREFVEEELVNSALSSSISLPSLALPATSKTENNDVDQLGLHDNEDEVDSHLNLSDSYSYDDGGDSEDHNHNYMINDHYVEPFSFSYPPRLFGEPYIDRWYQAGGQPLHSTSSSNVYYMNKSAPEIRTVFQEPPTEPTYIHSESYWNSPAAYGGNDGYFNWGSPATTSNNYSTKISKEKEVPPPPSPKASDWDFFNPFDVSDNGYLSYYSDGRYGHGSNTSSPDSNELREREGIPDLEEDTENEATKDSLKGQRMEAEAEKRSRASIPHSKVLWILLPETKQPKPASTSSCKAIITEQYPAQ